MAIPKHVYRAKVFPEFDLELQKDWFSISEKKVISNYDNFYYTVTLCNDDKSNKFKEYQEAKVKEDKEIARLRTFEERQDFLKNTVDQDEKFAIGRFISDLRSRREAFDYNSQDVVDFMGLDYYPFGLKMYNNRLSKPECFDILICDTIPTVKTPRIMVQIRASFLWLHGFKYCFESSFETVKRILIEYNIDIQKVMENRIDYAFHTNYIQNFEKYFDRNLLVKSCATNARIYNHVGDPNRDWSIDYLSIGSRAAKSVFFRAYNKTREVVEQAYKSFFFELWREKDLISKYDQYCLEIAYQLKSYDVGLLIGRINWYLQYGNDEILKNDLRKLRKECYQDNSNSSVLRKRIKGVLPEVTTICNLEFETHKDFYRSFDKSLLELPGGLTESDTYTERVFQIYDCRRSFVDYLTKFDGSVAFVDDVTAVRDQIKTKRNDFITRSNKLSYFDQDGFDNWKDKFINEHYLDFWRRVRSVDFDTDFAPKIYRTYERKVDVERVKRRICNDIAVLSIHRHNGPNTCFDINADMSDFYSVLNDNDMQFIGAVGIDGDIYEIEYGDYYTVKQRKNRQYSFLKDDENKK